MMAISDLKNKKILVVGLGKSGLSVSFFLHRQSIAFDVADDREAPPGLIELNEKIPNVQSFKNFDAALFCSYDILVLSPGLPLAMPAIQAAVASGVEVIGDIELFALVVNAPVIAVTGSNGKSTVVSWLSAVVADASIPAVLCGNIGLPALDALDESAELYILELSSFQLETTYSLRPISAAVLNLSEDHMDRYKDIEHYAATKRRIYNCAQLAVINAADSRTNPSSDQDVPVMCFSSVQSGKNCVGFVEHQGEQWLAIGDNLVSPVTELPLPGAHNCANAQAVIALLSVLPLDTQTIREGLKKFQGLPHRTELVAQHKGVRWYNDSKGTNVDACSKAIEAMQSPVILIAGGQGKDADFSELRPVVSQFVKALVLIGQDADKLYESLHDLASCESADSMLDAVNIAARIAVEGDAVLLSPACASFDMFDNFEHRGDVFRDAVLERAA